MLKKFGNTVFNLDFCRQFDADQLRAIYNGDLSSDVELFIEELYPSDESKPKKATKK